MASSCLLRRVTMRLCQPHLAAVRRSLIGASMIGAVLASFGLVGALALAKLIELRLAKAPWSDAVPYVLAQTTVVAGAIVLALVRTTVLNRRGAWLLHALGTRVTAHEFLMASDALQRARSLSAVTVTSGFVASPVARALADAPWSLIVLAGLWLFSVDVGFVAGTAAIVLLALAAYGARMTEAALAFDHAATAESAGDTMLRSRDQTPDLRPDAALAAATQWEVTQHAHLSHLYRMGQRLVRSRIAAVVVLGLAGAALASIALESVGSDANTFGWTALAAVVGFAALSVLARVAAMAPIIAEARAAAQHLKLLRTPRGQPQRVRQTKVRGPDQRLPAFAGTLSAMATGAALIAIATTWNLAAPFASAPPEAAASAVDTLRTSTARKDKT